MSDLAQRLREYVAGLDSDQLHTCGPLCLRRDCLIVGALAEVERLRDIINPGDAAAYEEGMAALLARCETAEARLAEAERLLRAWDELDFEECTFGDYCAVAIDQHAFDEARNGLDDFMRPADSATHRESEA